MSNYTLSVGVIRVIRSIPARKSPLQDVVVMPKSSSSLINEP
ncbi:hypothetical protein [Hydrocoleum sp. CS-953]|nr:hypothetical protein [Hydrocoleum sp. CS-953]